jgi:hypothetical protein
MAGRDPVAITKPRARSARPSALTSRGEVKTAVPRSTSMPSRVSTSAVSVAAIVVTAPRAAAIASAKLAPRPADSISVFDGTHPVKVHSPPISPSETSSTRVPAAAPARAAPSPAAPPPITIRS